MFNKDGFFEEFDSALKKALFYNSPFNKRKAVDSIKNFYAEFDLKIPEYFYIYQDACSAMKNFNEWMINAKEAVTAWDWNFPMTNPNGAWFNFAVKEKFDLAFKRIGPGLFRIKGRSYDAGTAEVEKEILKTMWIEIASFHNLSYYTELLEKESDILSQNDLIDSFLNDLLDVTSQISPYEVFFLGSDFKLVYEVAACNYLVRYHDIKRNSNYVSCINDILTYCGLVMAFDDVCVICKKINYS